MKIRLGLKIIVKNVNNIIKCFFLVFVSSNFSVSVACKRTAGYYNYCIYEMVKDMFNNDFR